MRPAVHGDPSDIPLMVEPDRAKHLLELVADHFFMRLKRGAEQPGSAFAELLPRAHIAAWVGRDKDHMQHDRLIRAV